MLTVRDTEADKVAALDAGADDYVTKPFNTSELLGADPRGAATHALDAGAGAVVARAWRASRSISTRGR